jgi:hypothetical protein
VDKSSAYKPVPFVTRYDKGDLSDKFFNNAIDSNDTIPRDLALMRKEYALKGPSTGSKDPEQSQVPEEPHFIVLCQLESGVNGYVNTAHGRVLAALLDETLGLCAEAYRVFVSSEQEHILTAKLEVPYHSPLPTPSIIVIKAG